MWMRCWRSSGKCVCCFVTLRQITTSKSTGPGPLQAQGIRNRVQAVPEGGSIICQSQAVAGTWASSSISRATSSAAVFCYLSKQARSIALLLASRLHRRGAAPVPLNSRRERAATARSRLFVYPANSRRLLKSQSTSLEFYLIHPCHGGRMLSQFDPLDPVKGNLLLASCDTLGMQPAALR